jgi:hypothetical protein
MTAAVNVASLGTAMSADSSGNVGVGTSSPWSQISSYGASGATTQFIGFKNADGGDIRFGKASGVDNNCLLGTFTGNRIKFYTNSVNVMDLDTSGNLQIGTTDQAFRLSVYETANKVATAIRAVNASYSSSCLLIDAGPAASGSFQLIQARSNFNSSAQTVFYVFGNGNVQNTNNSYGAISDIKLKENVVDATPKLDKLNQVRIVNFNMIGAEQKQIGVIAQELEQIFPGMVEESPDRDAEGNDLGTTTKGVKYSVFVPMLIKSIQELKAIVDAQAARITALEAP